MTTPPKAKKTPRNQPVNFDETLGTATYQSATVTPIPRFNARQIRLALTIIWMAAAAFAGIGIGRIIINSQRAIMILEPPVPVATASVSVGSITSPGIARSLPVSVPELRITPGTDITQAHAGQPFEVIADVAYQPANGLNALQPGFTHFGHEQGNIGTDSVY